MKAQELRKAKDIRKREHVVLLKCDVQCEELKAQNKLLKKQQEEEASSSKDQPANVVYFV